jgi:hypothetical protein
VPDQRPRRGLGGRARSVSAGKRQRQTLDSCACSRQRAPSSHKARLWLRHPPPPPPQH